MLDHAWADREDGADGEDVDRSVRRRDRRLLRRILLVVLVVVGGLYLAGYAFATDRLPRGTVVGGVQVGGLRPAQAYQELATVLRPRMAEPIKVSTGGRRAAVDPEGAGLDVDIAASLAQAPSGRSWDVRDMWETLVGGGDYPLVVLVVDDLLDRRMEALSTAVDRPAVDGAVSFSAAGAEPTYPQSGSVMDVPAAVAAVRAAFPTDGTRVELPMLPTRPEVSARQVSKAMKRFANPAMSAPVTYRLGGEQVVLKPRFLAKVVTMEAVDGRLVPRFDRKLLLSRFDDLAASVDDAPRDATVRIVDGAPTVVEARPGQVLDRRRIARKFLDVVVSDDGGRKVDLTTREAPAAVGTAQVRRLGVVEKVSEFTTNFPYAEYRNTNIGRGAELVNGTLLRPGQLFSLNRTVGERTRENGFTDGFVISNGVFKEDLGGGVSQVATTTFNAAFFAGLKDVEHKPHSFYIDRYPVGREATVAWPTVDLRFRNNTRHGVLIQAVLRPSTPSTQGALTVTMWSTKTWDVSAVTGSRYALTPPATRYLSGPDCVPNTGYSGFQIDVDRIFRRPGRAKIDHRERMHTTYTPADTVVCG